MYSLKITPSILEHRLDCGFYNPEGLEATKLLDKNTNSKPLSAVVDPGRCITNGVRGPDWQATKYKLIRLQDCGNWQVNHNEAASISFEQFEENKRCRLKANDIVVAIGGYVGNAAVLTEDCFAVIGQHSAVLPTAQEQNIDSRFLLAYLNSNIAKSIFSRYVSGTVQAGINLEDLRDLPAPVADRVAQRYIGDKVRQAEKLRFFAKNLRFMVDVQLSNLNLPINEPPQMLNMVNAQTLDDRLDPRPYRSHYLNLVKAIEALPHSPVSKLVVLASGCPVPSKDFIEGDGIPLVRIRNIGFDDFIGLDTGVSNEAYEAAVKYHAKEAMIVVGMDGNFRAQFFTADELPMLVNQRVAMLTPKTIRGELLTHWLNRPEGQLQLNQWAVKTTVEHTSLADIGRILIPRLDVEVEEQCTDALLNARLAYRYAKFLTQTAKALVEAIIEGQLTENQLIQAQQALDDGDTSLDQTILSKLSLDGYAVEGAKPLFSDVDELYRLLESAQAAEEGDI